MKTTVRFKILPSLGVVKTEFKFTLVRIKSVAFVLNGRWHGIYFNSDYF